MGLLGTLAPTCLDPDQLMPVPPGPRALQHVHLSSRSIAADHIDKIDHIDHKE